ncbi:fimbrial protein [Paraburkholderia sediminicola]|uniref:fimbrial protein n=1 Tax=Paraburkholderia sediminicola TaxID=458836 RepID=UPI0038BBC5AF
MIGLDGTCDISATIGMTAADGSFNFSGTFELVKTGPVTAGTIGNGAAFKSSVSGVALNNGSNAIYVSNNPAIRPVSCSVTTATANQTIPMAPVSPSALSSAGAVAGRTPFSIGLNCSSGVKVSVTFSSTSGNSGVASVLASTGTATGTGIQLLDASWTPIALDAARQVSSGTTGDDSFRFYAQYYRLGAAQVTPGTVNATAIFTMSYQ